jgi:DNA-directed RNA polymerase specialized sigma24 family protein
MDESSPTPLLIGDAELIRATAAGDAAAYATLRERHEPAARSLARQLVTDPAGADEVVSETFSRLHGVIRGSGGPEAAVRPYLLAAVRRVAGERSGGQPGATADNEAGRPSPGEPLPGDLAAEAESEPLARAFLSLPERWRAVLWHAEIEQAGPGQAAVVLGLTAQGVAELGEQARAGLSRAYLKLYLAGVTREDCRSAAGKLDLHLSGAARGHKEGKVQRHLHGCRACRAVAVELAGLGRSLRLAVGPVFLGSAAAAYLASVKAAPARRAGAPAGASAGTWVTRRLRGTRQALVAGVLLLAVFAVTGLTLVLAGNTTSPRTALHPAAAAAAPSRPAATVPLPAPARSEPAAPATPVRPTIPASPSPLDPDAAASPSPSPFFDHRHHRHHHHDPDQPSAP